MNPNKAEAKNLWNTLSAKYEGKKDIDCIVAPPFLFLQSFSETNNNVALAAQNCNASNNGAYTGEISVEMLSSLSIKYCIVGHSERRQYFGETDELIKTKIDALLQHEITPIFCCGENLESRKSGKAIDIVLAQINTTLFHLSKEEMQKIIIAYEPIWAIGTGVTATTNEAQEMHQAIRNAIAAKYDHGTANTISILYGGSCKPKNAKELFAQPDIDGGLIGGASLNAASFIEICRAFNVL